MADFWWGFQGTVNEVQWAKLMAGLGQKYTLVSGDPVRSTGRTVFIDPRLQIGAGVAFEHDAVKSLVVPTPAAGQWHLLVARRVWGGTPSVSYVLIPGATTADAAQATPPATLPAARNKTPGLTDDEPVAWIHTRASTTTLTLFQMSTKRDGRVPGIWAMFSPDEQGMFSVFSEADNSEYVWIAGAWRITQKSGKKTFTSIAMASAVAPVHWSGKLAIPFEKSFEVAPVASLTISSGDLILWPTAVNVLADKIEFRLAATNNVTVPTATAHWTITPAP